MAHFAEIDSDGIVLRVIVAEQDFIDTMDGEWIQTSYNTRGGKHYAPDSNDEDSLPPLRKNYAGEGWTYDKVRDAFYAPQPYPSWTLNEDTCIWEAPEAMPTTGRCWEWNEDERQWEVGEHESPHEGWVWNDEKKAWRAPHPRPQDGKDYEWSDEINDWIEWIP